MKQRHSPSERPKRNITWQGPMLADERERQDGDIRDVAGVAHERNVQCGLAMKIDVPTPGPSTEISAERIDSPQ
jgi:hypothetical protein